MAQSPEPGGGAATARSRWPRSTGPARRCALVDDLDLGSYHLFHAIRADLLRRLGRPDEAEQAYRAAIAGTQNTAERDFLERRRRALVTPDR